MPGDAGPAFEVDQIEFFRQLDVIQRLEIELRQRRLAAEELQVRLVVHADRGGGVREIGNRPHDRVRFGHDLVELLLDLGGLVADAAAFLLQRLALLRRGLADRAGRLVGLAIGLVQLRLQRPPLGFERDEAIDIGRGVAVLAVEFDEFDVIDDEFAVEHGSGGKGEAILEREKAAL